MSDDDTVHEGSGCVFRDIGLPCPPFRTPADEALRDIVNELICAVDNVEFYPECVVGWDELVMRVKTAKQFMKEQPNE